MCVYIHIYIYIYVYCAKDPTLQSSTDRRSPPQDPEADEEDPKVSFQNFMFVFAA